MDEVKEKPKRRVLQKFQERMYTYSHELVVCGKEGCSKCPHGPYWYVRWKQGDRVVTKYVGKVLRLIRPKGKMSKNGEDEESRPSRIAGAPDTIGGGQV